MADILIVDDNQNVLAELKALLNSLAPNLSIVATDSGRKGLSLARSRHPGIILLDINMPSFTGYDVLYELQKAPDTAAIPVIFLTGIFLSPEDRIRGLELGAAAYLTKPIDEAELLATIRNLLRLREMEKSLQKEREKLELKVSQRTAELKASRDAWHATFESISDWITIIDMKTRKVLQTNSAVKKMFGHTPQSIIGKPCCGIIHGTDKPVSDCPYCDVKRSGKTSRSRFKHYKSHRWFETTVEPLPAKKGQPQMAVHIVRDVTTQVVNQLAMEESERRFRIFFENQSTYCYMVSTDGIILAANRAAARVLGRKTSELVGTPVKEIYAPESQEQFQKNWAKWLKTGRLDNREMVIQARNGERRIVMLSARAIRDRDGKIMNSVSVQTDITEVKIMEERFHAIFDSSMDAIAV
ncbi:MAG: PAS domain S-box protein, partial [Fidelibacterota bacterium]